MQGCTSEYAEPERPQVFEDRDEAEQIMRYLNNGELDYLIMKQVFYDLYLIRALYGEKLPFLWCKFKPPGSIPKREPMIHRRINKIMMYPRKIRDGISYLYLRRWNEVAGAPIYINYHYFECKFDDVKYLGIYDPQIPVTPDWWIEAEKNLELYRTAL
jgi:hypothetical protein